MSSHHSRGSADTGSMTTTRSTGPSFGGQRDLFCKPYRLSTVDREIFVKKFASTLFNDEIKHAKFSKQRIIQALNMCQYGSRASVLDASATLQEAYWGSSRP